MQDIEKFNPTKSELLLMADKYKNLTIKDINDKEGYMAVYQARLELKKARVNLKKNGKAAREEALKYQKAVIALENELVGIIEPLEKDLEAKQDIIDKEVEKNKRKSLLPQRRERLNKINATATDDEIISMTDIEFQEFCNIAYSKFLEEKEKLAKIEEEKKAFALAEAETKRRAEQDKIEAERQAKIKEENEKLEAERKKIKEEQDKIEAEKKKIADQKAAEEREKQKQLEIEAAKKKAAEDEAKRIENERLAKEAEAKRVKEEMEKQAKYQNFLKDNNFDSTTDKIDQNGNRISLYRKIAEIII